MRLSFAMIIAYSLAYSFSAFAKNYPFVIYGEDNRQDVFETTNQLYVQLAYSTAAMVKKKYIYKYTDSYLIKANTLKDQGICDTEAFANQITAASCSGFLVGEDILVTAGHCMNSPIMCRDFQWVFSFMFDSGPATNGPYFTVQDFNVYNCEEIVEYKFDRYEMIDYAVIRLDRPVIGVNPLHFRRVDKVPDYTPLVVIGHPSGLPTKIAGGAEVVKNDHPHYFTADLDTYGGNSGSAVIDAVSGQVEGILVRGAIDYVYDSSKGCYESHYCREIDDDSCKGEDVTRITDISFLQRYRP